MKVWVFWMKTNLPCDDLAILEQNQAAEAKNGDFTYTAQCADCKLGCPCIQKCSVSYTEASVMEPYQ